MKNILYRLATAALFMVTLPIAAAPVPNTAKVTGDARQQLSAYFANIKENSPTVLGDLAKSPEAMSAIQKRIETMSDADVASFDALMRQAPDWKMAPEALARAFPPEMLEQIRRVSADYVARMPQGKEMREDVGTLTAVLKTLPDAKLKELGIDRSLINSLETTFAEMSPLQTAMLQRRVSESGPWAAKSAAAIGSLPPEMQRGAAALALHGAITTSDVKDLEYFRTELVDLLGRIDKLPEETRRSLNADKLKQQVAQLNLASPDVIFMVRENIAPEMMDGLKSSVAFLERIANLTDRQKADLEKFRGDLSSAFAELDGGAPASEDHPAAKDLLSNLDTKQLILLKDGMAGFPNWQTALPAVYRTLASPDLPARLNSLRGPTPDTDAIASLEVFRTEMLAFVDATANAPAVDATLTERARKAVNTAPVERLELMRSSLQHLPKEASAATKLTIVSMDAISFNCSVDMPSPVPDINLDFICNPIASALTSIRDGIVGTVNSIVDGARSALQTTINSVNNVLTSAINTVSNTVNSLVSSISSVATSILSFVQTIPSLVLSAINSALNLLLDVQIRNGITLRDLIKGGAQHAMVSMKTLLGLSEGWWNAVSTFTLPAIPCPPTGFHTPFGDVGDGAATDNYGRYKLVINGIVSMIPDTELSLGVKIPAQVLYMMFDFLGTCLQQASANADQKLASDRHDLVLKNFTDVQSFVGLQIGNLTTQSNNQTSALTLAVNNQTTAVQGLLTTQSAAIQALIDTKSTAIQSFLTSKSNSVQSVIQTSSDKNQDDIAAFQKLSLRLSIERVLQSREQGQLGIFQLLEPLGYLGLVRDIVRETIDSMRILGYRMDNAQKSFDAAVALLNAGSEKNAFREFSKAYTSATQAGN